MSQKNEESSFENFQAERRRQLRLQREREDRALGYEIEAACKDEYQKYLARKQNEATEIRKNPPAEAGQNPPTETRQSLPTEAKPNPPTEAGQNSSTGAKAVEGEPTHQQQQKPAEDDANPYNRRLPETQEEWAAYFRARDARTPEQVEEENRRDLAEAWRKESEGVDIVEMAFDDPYAVQCSYGLSGTLLGWEPWRPDEHRFAAKLLGRGENDPKHGRRIVKSAAYGAPDLAFVSPEICKFFICDRRVPKGDATVDDLYAEQLRLEAENDPLERAREEVRTDVDKILRHRARLFLAELEAAAEKGEEAKPAEIWGRMKPKRPDWVQALLDARKDFGFVFYKSKEARARPDAIRRWMRIFNDLGRTDNFGGYRTCFDGAKAVKDGFLLKRRVDAVWIEDELSEADPAKLRSHFKARREEISSTKPGFLSNTFIVVTSDCVPSELDHRDPQPVDDYVYSDEEIDEENPPIRWSTDNVEPDDVPIMFVWAYDADWEPPSQGGTSDEDGYEGRVKVQIRSLCSWFYMARLEGIHDMKSLWRKAQRHYEKVWACEAQLLDESKPTPFV